ncbi:sugar-binding transcriptional regulator [Anaeromicrobium sediminis]|uniref:Uncharacterized protein n=1 Tax=Anaeromicrobium sediminis TaxID=1478221 RepID=A0A267MN16_9FIRM|nr:sugar-binding domain-containing protein [Anaeromicrobium sediminis]PAB60802.1 hypothetical protein CCE28_04500 [Anaeromicrobium sediminis]
MLNYENSNEYMEEIIHIGKKLVPEVNEVFTRRYEILRQIEKNQPIGRRSLSQILEIGERIVRSEVNMLKEQGFIEIHPSGMNTTEFGENSLGVLKNFVYNSRKLHDLEELLRDRLNIKKVLIVMDSYDEDESVIKEVGKATASYFKSILAKDMIIGITGGKTMQMVAEGVGSDNSKNNNVVVVPGRGGLGRSVEKQSNTIAATLAEKLKASYRLLHVSDNISKELIDKLIKDPHTKEVVEYIKKIQTLIFGIGRADEMANNRGTEEDKIENIIKKGAVAEAFGYYFDKNGEIVEEVNTIGVSLNHYKELEHPIGAACGNQKAEAIIAISKLNKNLVLVIDEGLAKEIFKKI